MAQWYEGKPNYSCPFHLTKGCKATLVIVAGTPGFSDT